MPGRKRPGPGRGDGTAVLRVVLVTYRDDPLAGGSLRVAENLANGFDPSEVAAHLVFARGTPGPVSARARVPTHALATRGRADVIGWDRFRRLLVRIKPDVVHFVDTPLWMLGVVKALGLKCVVHVHGRPLSRLIRLRHRVISRAIGNLADAHVCITHGARRTVVDLGWANAERTWVVANGVDVGYFSAPFPRASARQRLGIAAGARVLGMVGRLVEHRGFQDGIRLLRLLPGDWQAVICGEGPFRDNLVRMARDLGLASRVHFTGGLDDVRPALAAMDGYLFTARYDSFGLATAEAMAAGVPVFGLGGDGEYAEPEYPLITAHNSVFVDRDNPLSYNSEEPEATLAALAARLLATSNDPVEARRLVQAARAWVAERFSATQQASRMAAVYHAVAGAAGR
ncbi:MAG: glycosyltransferase family 4 protein [Deltaproteobacteria bacterium]|nr:glycosyltransferase family 4 protein [Deltaproteobacteria bacterium]